MELVQVTHDVHANRARSEARLQGDREGEAVAPRERAAEVDPAWRRDALAIEEGGGVRLVEGDVVGGRPAGGEQDAFPGEGLPCPSEDGQLGVDRRYDEGDALAPADREERGHVVGRVAARHDEALVGLVDRGRGPACVGGEYAAAADGRQRRAKGAEQCDAAARAGEKHVRHELFVRGRGP